MPFRTRPMTRGRVRSKGPEAEYRNRSGPASGATATVPNRYVRPTGRTLVLMLCLAGWFAAAGAGGCAPKPPEPESEETVGQTRLYAFVPHPDRCLAGGEPVHLPPETTVRAALDHLAGNLAADYFNTPVATGIGFEVVDIIPVPGPERSLRVGIVNMVDPQGEAVRTFFQGSTGGRTTFCMVAATFLQPITDPPLLDGLVVRYNGAPFQNLDHIRMGGIVTPAQIRKVVYTAISLNR